MNTRRSYESSFWERDITSTEGFDRLCKHMKEEKANSDFAEKIIRMRAKADEDYAKSLVRISKATGEATETSSLRNILESLKTEMDNMAQAINNSAGFFNAVASKISDISKEQKSQRKNLEDCVTTHGNEKKTLFKKTMECKRLYFTKSQEAEQLNAQVQKAKQDNFCSTKDFEKLASRCTDARQRATNAEQEYRANVTKLSDARRIWEEEMAEYCQLCEKLDETRLYFMREQLWQVCNIISVTCVLVDENCETVRNSLERLKVDQELNSFVDRASTGQDRPDHLKFEPYVGSKA